MSEIAQPPVAVQLTSVSKRYRAIVAIDDISFSVRRGEYMCLVGPSGCGKTTMLRSIAGFVQIDRGSIAIEGRGVSRLAPNKRNLGMVYQNYALFPHMTVFENVAFGLRMRGLKQSQVTDRVMWALDLVHLRDLTSRRPVEMSGGQQQRVALARAIVIEPTVLLLDEPLSNLDAKLRKNMQMELKALQRSIGLTTIHVTHDQEEALTLADIVVIMSKGKLQQIGPPREVYLEPNNAFVADFLGEANFLTGRVAERVDRDRQAFVTDGGLRLIVQMPVDREPGSAARLLIRPERVSLTQAGGNRGENSISAMVRRTIFSGSVLIIEIELIQGLRLMVERASGSAEGDFSEGDAVLAYLPADALRIIADG
jgi:spermidine/putrescine ABC transporter ATP-binding subunit